MRQYRKEMLASVIRSVVGNKKTAVFTILVVVMATAAGIIYGKELI